MVRSVEGIYRDGKVELFETPPVSAEMRVIVTFLSENGSVSLPDRGVDEAQAADLRRRLAAGESDWRRPEMDAYDAL